MFKAVFVFLLLSALLPAEKLTSEQRIDLIRGLTAEYATAKTQLPRSKKALELSTTGEYDHQRWEELNKEMGPAARKGDLIQITKVDIEGEKLVLQLNGGVKGGRKWYQNVEVGTGSRTRPIGGDQNTAAPGGTTVALLFDKQVPPMSAAEVKKLLLPILDFERRSATENAIDLLPPEIKAAVVEKRPIEGMDREQVMMAIGKPRTKTRETKEGLEEEDWIYGQPPGKVTFVTFANGKVVRVKDAYAGLGGETVPSLKPQL
jgi:hypothetical protein